MSELAVFQVAGSLVLVFLVALGWLAIDYIALRSERDYWKKEAKRQEERADKNAESYWAIRKAVLENIREAHSIARKAFDDAIVKALEAKP